MKLFFILVTALVFYSCSSVVKKDGSAKTINSGDPVNAVQNSTVSATAKLEHQDGVSQEHILWVDIEDKNISLTITNVFPEELFYDVKFFFERFDNEKWQQVDYVKNYGIQSIEYILKPGETRTQAFSFKVFNKPLSEGNYRVIKEYYFNDAVKREQIKRFTILACNKFCLIFPAVVKRQDLIAQKPILYSVINNTDDTYITGDRFFLERRNNGGQWEEVTLKNGLVNDIGYKINPHTKNSDIEMHTYFLRNLPNGSYRITKPAFEFPGKNETTIRAEFEVID